MTYANIEDRRAAQRRRYATNPKKREMNEQWKKDHPEQHAKHKADRKERIKGQETAINRLHNLRRYGLTQEIFDDMLASQNGACALCGSPAPGAIGNFRIDHDHSCCPGANSCGRCVRGLLCHLCNIALGNMRDNPETLRKAAEYLENHAARLIEERVEVA